MSAIPSIRIRTRGDAVVIGLIGLVFALWLFAAPAGWPFFGRVSVTWRQAFLVKLLPSFFVCYFALVAMNSWCFRLELAQRGITYRRVRSKKAFTIEWNEIKNWRIHCSMKEGTTNQRKWTNIDFLLVDLREWWVTLTPFGPDKTEEVIAVLRFYIGDCEFPEVTL